MILNGAPIKVFACENGFIVMPLRGSMKDAMIFKTFAELTAWMGKHYGPPF